MPNCQSIDPLVTPYVDNELPDVERRDVDEHLRACPPCAARVTAERAVRELVAVRKDALVRECAPRALHARCAQAARLQADAAPAARVAPGWNAAGWRARFAPLAAAASLVLIVGAAFLYQLTSSSSRVMAAELAADHVKCFAVNGVLQMHESPATVESSMLSAFGWRMHVPEAASTFGLQLLGARPCLYGKGRMAHIMYMHNGEPVSLFMLPRTARAQEFVQVMGHHAAIWCANNRTFVLLAHEPKAEVERIANAVQASLR